METLISILAFIFILGVAVNIHEFGHFIVAKIFGMRIEAYSFFGLGPRIWGFKWGNTDYRLCAIPLGAYVKLYGDEATSSLEGGSSQGESVPPSELYELRPRWQKFLVLLGGPFMNIVLALAIPFTGAMIYGVPAMPSPTVAFVKPDGAAAKAGILPGDKIIAFDGTENPTMRRIEMDALLLPDQTVPITVERNGEKLTLQITPTKQMQNGNALGTLDFEPDRGAEIVVIGAIRPDMPAAEAGLLAGDRIISLNGTNIRNREQLMSLIQQNKDGEIKLLVERNGENKEFTTRAKIDEGVPRIGIQFSNMGAGKFEPADIGTALGHAVGVNIEILRLTFKALGQVFTGARAAKDTVSGPIGIFQESGRAANQFGWAGIIQLLAVISLSLGVFNLLPIPMLDGGQIMMLGIEKVLSWFKMTLSMVWRERIQIVGLAAILLLMVFVFYTDISRIVTR